MSVIVIKSETTGYRILVKAGDEELARQEAVKAAISAEAARLSAIDAGASEQVATQKAAQTVEDAAEALASKQEAESAATDSGGFATNSGISATNSNTAKGLSEAAKVIAIEEAGKSSTSAGQSAASAAAAAASSELITNKAEVNIVTDGNILRANGTLFKSISEVEFLRNKDAFAKSYISALFDSSEVLAFDSFNRADGPIGIADSGQTWEYFGSVVADFVINGNRAKLSSPNISGNLLTGIDLGQNYQIISVRGKVNRRSSSLGLFLGLNSNFYYYLELDTNFIQLAKSVNGVNTIIKFVAFSNTIDTSFNIELRIIRTATKLTIFVDSNIGVLFSPINADSDYAIFTHVRFAGISSKSIPSTISNFIVTE
jgi:hypothetical protein